MRIVRHRSEFKSLFARLVPRIVGDFYLLINNHSGVYKDESLTYNRVQRKWPFGGRASVEAHQIRINQSKSWSPNSSILKAYNCVYTYLLGVTLWLKVPGMSLIHALPSSASLWCQSKTPLADIDNLYSKALSWQGHLAARFDKMTYFIKFSKNRFLAMLLFDFVISHSLVLSCEYFV